MVAHHGDEEPPQHSPNRHQTHPQLAHENEPDRRPWYKRPSPAWIFYMKALSSCGGSVTSGPRLEMFRELVCRSYTAEHIETPGFLSLPSNTTSVASVALNFPATFMEAYLPQNHQAYMSLGTVDLHNVTIVDCASNPHVQADIAKLAAVITIISGVLSCLTTGWWGGFLDRHGRTRTMGILVFGPLMSDLLNFFVFHFSDILPGKYWWLIIAPVIEGMLGTPSSTMAAETSYVSDVSEPHNLARNFSLLVGIFYTGSTIGPVLGGFLNQQTNSVMGAYYAATFMHFAYAAIAWFAMPESITETAMAHARSRYADEAASVVDTNVSPFRRQVKIFIKGFWASFPLNVLIPKRQRNSQRKRDWNLTWLAISAALINAAMASTSSVYQYALYIYRWSSLDLGYFISATGLSTVLFLTVIFPATISVLRRRAVSPQDVGDVKQNTLLDLHMLRASSIFLAAGYALMGIAPTGLIFTFCSIISTFGQGFLPTIQSVAAILYISASGEGDTGRLFGALSVVYVVGGRIIGPALYGTVYVMTVSFFASAIFWLSVGCCLTAFLILAFIRLPDDVSDREQRCDDLDHYADPELDPLLDDSTPVVTEA